MDTNFDEDPIDPPKIGPHDPGELLRAATGQPGAPPRHTPAGAWEPPSPEALSALLPGFDVTALLGRGGMGAVYRGLQKSLDREVAIKLLPPELGADPEFEARFRHEARAMAQLNHPNIVQIFDFGQTAEGHHYFVMEFVDGVDMHILIRSGELDAEGALNAISQICDALEYAHGKGFVHRDIKPANIFINQEGTLKVGDFGLAKIVDPDPRAAAEPGLTMTGMAMGTPQYVAPEQIAADGKLDHRADIYSLGVMFYEMLTGSLPHGAVKPPSQRIKALDVRIDDVVFKAMDPDPGERYQSAFDLRTDVDGIRNTPISGIPAEPGPPAPPPSKNLMAILAAVAVVLALGAASYFYRPPAAPPAASGFQNHLGMRFVPVPITGGPSDGKPILFSIWETRVCDYRAFAEETRRLWPEMGFEQGEDHPALRVSWFDAVAFCEWLTETERDRGTLPAGSRYRLPTDHEWSCAVGIGHREDPAASPADKDQALPNLYPWGGQWPPPAATGNLFGEENELEPISTGGPKPFISGYRDSFLRTSPVGSFPPNKYGLFDLTGNAAEWVQDWYSPEQSKRVNRGGAWSNAIRPLFLASDRVDAGPGIYQESWGFRVVLEIGTAD